MATWLQHGDGSGGYAAPIGVERSIQSCVVRGGGRCTTRQYVLYFIYTLIIDIVCIVLCTFVHDVL